jgi:hypothetical protein
MQKWYMKEFIFYLFFILTFRFLKAETEQEEACKKFEDISKQARAELVELKKTRIAAFKKNLSELAELEIKQSKVFF